MIDGFLARYIENGPGTRLPPERQLAAESGLSRSEIRKALARMEIDGRLSREVGRGTFVRAPTATHSIDLENLRRNTGPREAMEARILIEPELASLAAVNATFKQIEAMHVLAKQMRQAETWKAYEQHDGTLHCLVAEASGNKLLADVHKTIDEVRRAVVWKSLDTRPCGPPANYSSFGEHDDIIAAIELHDRVRAREAMRRHLRTTIDNLLETNS